MPDACVLVHRFSCVPFLRVVTRPALYRTLTLLTLGWNVVHDPEMVYTVLRQAHSLHGSSEKTWPTLMLEVSISMQSVSVDTCQIFLGPTTTTVYNEMTWCWQKGLQWMDSFGIIIKLLNPPGMDTVYCIRLSNILIPNMPVRGVYM